MSTKVIIPTIEAISEDILIPITKQSIVVKVIPVVCKYDSDIHKRKRIAMAKEACRAEAIKTGDPFIIMHDNDLLELKHDNFKYMKSFLVKNTDYGAVALRRKGKDRKIKINPPHICNSVIMIRREALKDLRFDLYEYFPTCISTYVSLNNGGWKYDYLDDKIRIEHTK